MSCRSTQIRSYSSLVSIAAILSLVAIFPSEQLTPKNEPSPSAMRRLQKAHGNQSLSARDSNELKDYYDYRRLNISHSFTS